MKLEAIKLFAEAKKRQEMTRLLAHELRLNNGAVADTCRSLGITMNQWEYLVKTYPRLKALVDSSNSSNKTSQPFVSKKLFGRRKKK